MSTDEQTDEPRYGFTPEGRKLAAAYVFKEVIKTFVDVDLLEREQVCMSDELTDEPRFRSGFHSIYMYPLAHLSNEVKLIVFRLENAKRSTSALALYHDRIGLYNPYTPEDLVERITDGHNEGELPLADILVSAAGARKLMIVTNRVNT